MCVYVCVYVYMYVYVCVSEMSCVCVNVCACLYMCVFRISLTQKKVITHVSVFPVWREWLSILCLVFYRLGRQFSSYHTFSFMLLVGENANFFAKKPRTVCCMIETQSTVTLYNLLYSIVLEHCVVC